MPDRDIKFDSAAYPKAAQPCYLKIGEFMASALSQQEAREIFFQIGEQMGYTWTHRTEKKPTPAEPTPQARQDIAATATLHGMGYRWSDTNQWWQPVGDVGSNSVGSLKAQLEVAKNGASQAEYFRKQMKFHSDQRVKGIEFLDTVQEALGLEPGGDQAAILPAIKALKSTAGGADWADTELNRIGAAVGITEEGECSTTFIVPAIERLKEAKDMNERVMHCYFNACRTLGLPASTESCKEVMPAIEHLQRQLEERKQLAEVQQRANTEATSLILRIHNALGVEEPFDAEGTGIIPAIRALKTRASNGYGIKELGKIREALGIEAPKVGQYPGDCIINAIEALKTRLDTSAVNMREIADALRLPQGSARISLVLPSVQALRDALDQGYAALKDHGYTPDRAESIGTLIRDAFGAEAAKLRQATKAIADTWDILRCFGHTQPERGDVLSAAVRIALSCHQDDGAPPPNETQIKHDAYERAAKVADEWYQNHGTVLLLRVAQEIRALKR